MPAWVVMPEHVHLLIIPSLGAEVPKVLRAIKEPFAREVIKRWRDSNHVRLQHATDSRGVVRFWQRGGGYDRNITGGDEYNEKIVYIHENPVRRGLVREPEEWRWSSAGWAS